MFRTDYVRSLHEKGILSEVETSQPDSILSSRTLTMIHSVPDSLKGHIRPPEVVESEGVSVSYKLFVMDLDGGIYEVVIEFNENRFTESQSRFLGYYGQSRWFD